MRISATGWREWPLKMEGIRLIAVVGWRAYSLQRMVRGLVYVTLTKSA